MRDTRVKSSHHEESTATSRGVVYESVILLYDSVTSENWFVLAFTLNENGHTCKFVT
jgi:hypothetical protein